MKKAIVYSTTTGNTEAMANAIADGAKNSGAEVLLATADAASVDEVAACDVILLGSPAMGDEVLEDSMEEFFSKLESRISGKKIGIFGSYDWGDGKWLRDWADRIKSTGAILVGGDEGLKAHLTPEEDDLKACINFGASA